MIPVKKRATTKGITRRNFARYAVVLSVGIAAGLTYLKDAFLLTPRVKKQRPPARKKQPPLVTAEEGFYLNRKKERGDVIYYLSKHKKEEGSTSPSLKPIANAALPGFVKGLTKIEIGEVVERLQKNATLLNPVWACEKLLAGIEPTALFHYKNLIRTILTKKTSKGQPIVGEITSRVQLVNLYAKCLKKEAYRRGRSVLPKMEAKKIDNEIRKQRDSLFNEFQIFPQQVNHSSGSYPSFNE